MRYNMKSLIGETITPEMVDQYAYIESTLFGDVILGSMGFNAVCVQFHKTDDPKVYAIVWGLESGAEYADTFHIDEIMKSFKGKTLELTMEVKRGD